VGLAADGGAARGATVALLGALFAGAAGGALALVIMRDRKRPAAPHPGRQAESQVLARAIAELDARFEGEPAERGGSRAAYESERRVLKERLREALAREPGRA
jgi:hypothetical protein